MDTIYLSQVIKYSRNKQCKKMQYFKIWILSVYAGKNSLLKISTHERGSISKIISPLR